MTSPGYGKRKKWESEGSKAEERRGDPMPLKVKEDGDWINGGWRQTPDNYEFRLVADYEYFSTDSRMRWFLFDFSGHIDNLVLQLPFKSDIKITFSKQSKYDAWAIEKSISAEVQTGDAAFDAEVFIDCDNETEVNRLLGEVEVRQALTKAFANGVSEIRIDSQGTYAVLKEQCFLEGERRLRGEKAHNDIEELVSILRPITRKLAPFKGKEWCPSSILFNFGVMVGGVIAIRQIMKMMGCQTDGFRCDVVPYESVFWPYLMAVSLLSMMFWLMWLKAGPRRVSLHRRALKGAILNLTFLIVLWPVYTGLNRLWATDEGQWVQVQIQEKFRRGVRHNYFGRHNLIISDWRGGDEYLTVPVASDLYEDAEPGRDCLKMQLRDGAFGYTVMSDMNVYQFEGGGCPAMVSNTKGDVN